MIVACEIVRYQPDRYGIKADADFTTSVVFCVRLYEIRQDFGQD